MAQIKLIPTLDQLSKSMLKTKKDIDNTVKSQKEHVKAVKEVQKALQTCGISVSDHQKSVEALQKKYDDNAISADEFHDKLGKLNDAFLKSNDKATKFKSSLSDFASKIGSAKAAVAGLVAALGFEMSFKGITNATVAYGGSLYNLSQKARATGRSMSELKDVAKQLTGKGFDGTTANKMVSNLASLRGESSLTSDQIIKLSMAAKASTLTFEDAEKVTAEFATAVQGNSEITKKMYDTMNDPAAFATYLDGLVRNKDITDDFRQSLLSMQEQLAGGKNAADDKEYKALGDALNELYAAGKQLAIEFGESCTPQIKWLADEVKELAVWVKNNCPEWVKWAVVVGGAIAPVVIAIGGVMSALLPLITTVGGPLLEVMGLAGGAAGVFGAALTAIPFVAVAAVGVAALYKLAQAWWDYWDSANNAKKETQSTLDALAAAKDRIAKTGTALIPQVPTEAAKPVSQADTGRKNTNTDISGELNNQYNQLERQLKLLEKHLALEKTQLEYTEKYSSDLGAAFAANDKIVSRLKNQKSEYDKILSTYEKLERLGKLTKEDEASRAEIMSKVVSINGQIQEQELHKAHILDQTLSVEESKLGNLEAEMNLQKSLYAGLGPQLDTLSAMNDEIEKMKMLFEKQLSIAKQKLSLDPENLEAQKAVLDVQRKLTEATQKQVDLTKNLKEGYLDALSAFTNVSGSFSKIITRKDQNLGEMLRSTGQSGSLRGGGIGGGFTNPYAKFKAGGQLEVTGRDQLDRLQKARGLDQLGKPMVSATSAIGGMNEGQKDFSNTGKNGQLTGPGSAGTTPTGTNSVKGPNAPSGKNDNVSGPATTRDGSSPQKALYVEIVGKFLEQIKSTASSILSEPKADSAAPGSGSGAAAAASDAAADKAADAQVAAEAERQNKMTPEQKKQESGELAKQENSSANDYGMASKISQKEKELKAIQNNIDKNPYNYKGNVNIGNTSASQGGGGREGPSYKDRKGAYDAKMDKDHAAFQATVMRGELQKKMNDLGFKGKSVDEVMAGNHPGGAQPHDYHNGATMSMVDSYRTQYETMKHLEEISKNTDDTNSILEKSVTAGQQSMVNNGSDGTIKSGGNVGDVMSHMAASMFGMATGGTVGGTGTGDTQPALLTPGETVVTKEASRKYGKVLAMMNKNKFAMGGIVGGGAPSGIAMGGGGGGGGGGSPISINVKGDSVDKIMKSVTTQLSGHLNKMMMPHGTTGRQFELSQ